MLPIPYMGGLVTQEKPAFYFNPLSATFTASMAKRATSVFAAAPIVQGKRDGTGVGDGLNTQAASLINSGFYNLADLNQGTITFRYTPEINTSGDDVTRYLCLGPIILYTASNVLGVYNSNWGTELVQITGLNWVAGTIYNITIRFDTKNPIDGTNYVCVSINDAHTFGRTSTFTFSTIGQICIGGNGIGGYTISGIVEGFTIYRRVLYDGTYGVNVGNGDEVALIAAGIDPCTVTGSWDVCFCLPTNSTPGALVTGTGEAWSHPHSSNLLTRGFLNDRYYGGGPWGVKFNGTTTDINCGDGAT